LDPHGAYVDDELLHQAALARRRRRRQQQAPALASIARASPHVHRHHGFGEGLDIPPTGQRSAGRTLRGRHLDVHALLANLPPSSGIKPWNSHIVSQSRWTSEVTW
jgi:hypothetical protein